MKKHVRLTFVVGLFLTGALKTQASVYIPDPLLKKAIEDTLRIDDPTWEDMLGLTSLTSNHDVSYGILTLEGLEAAGNLQELTLSYNRITDISTLTYLSNLETVILNDNFIQDLSPLHGLTNIRHLDLHRNLLSDLSALAPLTKVAYFSARHNSVSDISVLRNFPDLWYLNLHDNQIRDIGPLTDLKHLETLELDDNLLDQEAFQTHLHTIVRNNPGLRTLRYKPNTVPPTTVHIQANTERTSLELHWEPIPSGPNYTSYYRVYRSDPEGVQQVLTNWQRAPHYVDTLVLPDTEYLYWIRTASDNQGLEAGGYSKAFAANLSTAPVSSASILFVGHGLSEPDTFSSIQSALDVAVEGTMILVHSGTYVENLLFPDVRVQLIGISTLQAPFPVIDGNDQGPVLRFVDQRETASIINGFVLTNGLDAFSGAIDCQGGRSTFSNCLIVGNQTTNPSGAAVYCSNSNVQFYHCTIADNLGHGLALHNSDVAVKGTIFWNNTGQSLYSQDPNRVNLDYSTTEIDPLFVRSGRWVDTNTVPADWQPGDYHLQSQFGRWSYLQQDWMVDSMTSPCIDLGDPLEGVGLEPLPHGDISNLGAYGRSQEASKSEN